MLTQTKIEEVCNQLLPTLYTTATHPLTHARTLMQLGYEPLPPYLGHSPLSSVGLGRKVFKLPSIFPYCKHLRDKVGVVGIFTIGLPSRIIFWYLSSTVSDFVLYKLSDERQVADARCLNTNSDFREFIYEIRNLTIARSVAVFVAYPFQVLMVRQMAEIMNVGDNAPKNFFSLALHILDDEGVQSLYNGVGSKLIGEISTIWLTAAFVYVFNKYILKDRVAPDIKDYSSTIGGFLCSNLTYRFSVISTVMSVSGSKIRGTVTFESLFKCYSFLNDNGGFNRGSSLFLRYAA